MINRPPRAQGLAANISNPQAANLARQINNGGDVRTLVKEAIVDAQIHKDWSRVAAIENSLLRVDDRTIARHLGAVGTRAVVLSRTDEGGLAARIPEGYQHGLAWLVCLLFVRLDSDIETARAISKSFWSKARAVGGFGVDWGSTPLCFPPLAFGGPSRILLTESVGRGETSFLYEIRDFTARSVLAQENASTGGITSLAHILWGTVVTGTNDPLADLFNEDIWCPGFDHPAFAPEMTRLLAEASTGYDGDTFIHPECMPAPVANDFARSMVNEQVISQVIEGRLKPTLGEQLEGASVRISKLVPNSLPYMDQLLISIWTRANILVQTLRIPRTGNPLEADAQTIADFCRAQGIKNVFMPELASPIGANDYPGYAVGMDGVLVKSGVGGLGDASSLIQSLDWEGVEPDSDLSGVEKLPFVLVIEKYGVMTLLGRHYQPPLWHAIKESLSRAGDPIALMKKDMGRFWQGAPEDLPWALDAYERALLPERAHALAAQFKLSGGAVVQVTPGLVEILQNTDIGEDCPSQFLQGGFDVMYLVFRVPAQAYSEESDDDDADEVFLIDGVLVQRWEEAGVQHLQLDGFITRGPVDGSDPFLTEVATLNVLVGETSTLADLYSQMDLADGVLKQALDLYAGVMLYMNSRDARVQRKDEHAEAAAALAALNRKKRRKEHYQRLNSSVDAIHVGPETVSAEGEGLKLAHGRHGVKPHYRRGFVRFNQRFGKGRLQTRPVLIPPVLVNAHKLAGDSPGKKQYVVGSSRTDEK
jgi:hypothetical protein